MADFTAQDVKALREATGAGMMDCKKALTEANGDAEAARQILREKGLNKAASRSDRDSNEGAVAVVQDGNRAALAFLKCETDFSAKSEDFVATTRKLAEALLGGAADPAADMASDIEDLQLTKKENISIGKLELIEAAEGNSIDVYVHQQDGRGINGVIVEGSGIDADTLHQVALHVAFAKPSALTRDEISEEAAATEREALLEITKAEGKPEQAWDKIVEGRLNAWYGESVLLEQGLHGDKTAVKDSIGGGSIARFSQAYIGS